MLQCNIRVHITECKNYSTISEQSGRNMELDDAAVCNHSSHDRMSPLAPSSTDNSLTSTETEMINHIVQENKAFFRSQQINDPDITEAERSEIVQKVLRSGHKKFLYRFGNYIRADHLSYFEDHRIQNPNDEDDYEIGFFLRDIRKKLHNRQRDVKNRRYAAMRKMIENDDDPYFSEQDMMGRQPLLYEQLVGQYLTDTEKKQRDNFDPDIEFSGVLLDGIAKRHLDELRQKQLQEEEEETAVRIDDAGEEDEDSSASEGKEIDYLDAHEGGIIDDQYYPQTPPSFKQHWGDFEDDSCTIGTGTAVLSGVPSCSRATIAPHVEQNTIKHSVSIPREIKQIYVTADEKELLREEFIGIMQANFLSGKDKDFDYSTVDDNADYDNIDLQAQDEEDKYFDADDDDEINRSPIPDPDSPLNRPSNETSEDELDNYMNRLNENK